MEAVIAAPDPIVDATETLGASRYPPPPVTIPTADIVPVAETVRFAVAAYGVWNPLPIPAVNWSILPPLGVFVLSVWTEEPSGSKAPVNTIVCPTPVIL